MKKINDSIYYFYFAIATLFLGIICGIVSFYSILYIEPKVKNLISADKNISKNYKDAYLILRSPQIFARYENFDNKGLDVRKSIISMDKLLYSGSELVADVKPYLNIILERRMKGSRLGRNTMFFLLLISSISWILLFFEKRQIEK